MHIPKRHALRLLTLLMGLGLTAAQANAASVIQVHEGDYGGHLAIKLSTHRIEHGKVTFHDVNTDKDLVHELVLFKTDLPAARLPYDRKSQRVEEDKLKDVGEIENLQPGHKATRTFDLKPGRYVLVCNEPGHYRQGMYSVLHVR